MTAAGAGDAPAAVHLDQNTVGRDIIILLGGEQDVSALLARYRREVAEEANILPLAIVQERAADPERGRGLQLADVYTALDTTEVRQVAREEELRAFMARLAETERVAAQEAADSQARLLILGDPGSGKSTFVKHLAYTLATAAQRDDPLTALAALDPWSHRDLLPVYVALRNVAALAVADKVKHGKPSLIDKSLQQQLDEWGLASFWPALSQIIESKKCRVLFLFDGLDEVPTDQRQLLVEAVNAYSRRYAQHRMIVTCRPYAYVGQPWQLHDFHTVTLAPFSRAQIDRFVANWYRRLGELKLIPLRTASERMEPLQQALRRPDLHGLAERPLLLTVMAQLHTFTGRLPDDRTELYADAVDLMLQRWESRVAGERGLLQLLDVPGLRMSDLEAGLYDVAFRAHQLAGAEGTADIDEQDLRDWLAPYLGNSFDKAQRFVDYIRERAGLLYRHKTAAYTFPHRTFQEFLAACFLTGHTDYPGEAARRTRQEPDRWREVFLLAAGHAARTHRLSQAVSAVNHLCPEDADRVAPCPADRWQTAVIAGEALLEIGLVGVLRDPAGRVLVERVRDWLAAALTATDALPAKSRAEAGRVLGKLGDPRPEVMTLAGMPFCYVPAGSFVMGEGNDAYEHDVPYDYWIGRFPVTNAQFDAFVETGGYGKEQYWEEAIAAGQWHEGKVQRYYAYYDEAGNVQVDNESSDHPHSYGEPYSLPNHPIVGVTWYEALAYTRWLTDRARADGWIDEKQIIRLPNEPEWEKAARGGQRVPTAAMVYSLDGLTAHGRAQPQDENPNPARRYPWGDAITPQQANYADSEIDATSAAGCFPDGISPYSTEELSGTVWEWTRSLWGKEVNEPDFRYPYRKGDDREDLAARPQVQRVLRGGAFYYFAANVRCARRYWFNPYYALRSGGFRLVLSPLF